MIISMETFYTLLKSQSFRSDFPDKSSSSIRVCATVFSLHTFSRKLKKSEKYARKWNNFILLMNNNAWKWQARATTNNLFTKIDILHARKWVEKSLNASEKKVHRERERERVMVALIVIVRYSYEFPLLNFI